MKKILVTGCAGFIGSNFVKKVRRDYPDTQIIGLDNFSTGKREIVHPEINFYKGSVADRQLTQQIFSEHRPEYVFHFAALPRVSYSVEHPYDTTVVNTLGTINILDQARQHETRRVVFSSSSAIYGGAKHLPTNEKDNAPDPQSPYGLQKLVAEPFCKMFGELYQQDSVCLRYFNVYGPGQHGDAPYSTVVSAWLEKMYFPDDKKPFLEGDGTQSRDFVYVDDVIQANLLAAQHAGPLRGDFFNIGQGQATTIQEVKELIEKLSGQKLDLEMRAPRVGDVKHTLADISKAQSILGYKPQVAFKEGLAQTIAWFEDRKKLVTV